MEPAPHAPTNQPSTTCMHAVLHRYTPGPYNNVGKHHVRHWQVDRTSQIRALSLPAPSQCLVELDHTQQLSVADLRQCQLGLKQIAIGIQSVELGIDAGPGSGHMPGACDPEVP
jgi:hypothetical protein